MWIEGGDGQAAQAADRGAGGGCGRWGRPACATSVYFPNSSTIKDRAARGSLFQLRSRRSTSPATSEVFVCHRASAGSARGRPPWQKGGEIPSLSATAVMPVPPPDRKRGAGALKARPATANATAGKIGAPEAEEEGATRGERRCARVTTRITRAVARREGDGTWRTRQTRADLVLGEENRKAPIRPLRVSASLWPGRWDPHVGNTGSAMGPVVAAAADTSASPHRKRYCHR